MLFSRRSLFSSAKIILSTLIVAVVISGFQAVGWSADTDFSDGITVDSNLDTSDANVGDNQCDDGSGNCTLRAAIEESNVSSGTQTVNFALSSVADFVNNTENGYRISLTSALPNITDTIIIDGYSQTGAQANTAISPNPMDGTLLVELDGTSAGGNGIFGDPSNVHGIAFASGSAGSTVQGLIINDFTGAGINVTQGADNISIYGNYIGTDYEGLIAERNAGQGVSILGPTGTTGGPENGNIGGTLAAQRNIISGNDSNSNDPNLVIGVQGISITSGSPGWEIKGNYIGVGADGVTDIGNELGGMTIDYVNDLTVGGPESGAANVISGNGDGGIQPDGCDNIVIQGNFIGTDYTGTVAVPNFSKGISFIGTTNSIVGGVNPGEGNIIANAGNSAPGIFLNNGTGIEGPLDYPDDIAILGNSIFDNSSIGIDLNFDTVTANDGNDNDTGANGLLNFPEYYEVSEVGGDTTVNYRLDVPAGDYRIEFFANSSGDASGYGEGQTFLGFDNISHTGSGIQNYSHVLTGMTGLNNLAMTTTERNVATNSTFGSTSEFSANTLHVASADMSISSEIINPSAVTIGSNLTYEFTLTNLGPDTVDLSDFPGDQFGINNLVTGVLPTDILYFGNVDDSDIVCNGSGAGSASMFGAALGNHSDNEIIVCSWAGSSRFLEAGQSFTFSFEATVQPASDLVFDAYFIVPPSPSSDPDSTDINNILTSGSDIIDQFLATDINNFSVAEFPVPVVQEVIPAPDSVGSGSLALSGTSLYLSVVALFIALLGFALLFVQKRRRFIYES